MIHSHKLSSQIFIPYESYAFSYKYLKIPGTT